MANFSPTFKVNFLQLHQVVAGCLAVTFVLIAVLAAIEINRFYADKYLPNTFVNQLEISNLTTEEALAKLSQAAPPIVSLTLTADGHSATLSAEQVRAQYDYANALQTIATTSTATPWYQRYWRALGFARPIHEQASIQCDPIAVTTAVTDLAQLASRPNRPPSITLATSGNKDSLKVSPGQAGYEIDPTTATQVVLNSCREINPNILDTNRIALSVALPVMPPPIPLSPAEVTTLTTTATQLVGKRLALNIQHQTFYFTDQQLVSFLSPNGGWSAAKIDTALQTLSQHLLAEPSNAVLEYDPTTLKVSKFIPPRDGLKIDLAAAVNQITPALDKWIGSSPLTEAQQDLSLVVTTKQPEVTLAKTNNLGITELIGYGDSAYAHSIPTRVHNVALTAKNINLTIVKPGEEFSFNKTLGEVSAATGFQPAYVIRSGRTELGDGGGVCQVSSTLFRAAMNAGLKITKRLPHSYRVSYYELNSKAGFDATVYSGNVDFRFINDTPGHILIYTETDTKNLTMKIELYGTKDGRVSTISDYKSWGASKAPPPVYIDDPSLPPGKLKQVDWATGGLKTSFVYTVTDKTGTVKQQETYYSNYLPWSAKYLRGV